jgi:hypothetical protein
LIKEIDDETEDEARKTKMAILRFMMVIISLFLYLTFLLRSLTLFQQYHRAIDSASVSLPPSLKVHITLIQTEFMVLTCSCIGVMIFIGIRYWTPYRVERFETGFGHM